MDELPLRELHVFAGAGGGILGGLLLGHVPVCAVEFSEYPRKVLLQRQRDGILPWFPVWDDVRTFDGKPWRGKVDIICGGFPCQDISAAGKGAGIDGARSGLWSEMARIIGEVRPDFVFVENSPMLVCRGLGRVLGDLAALGYDAEWCVLGAVHAGAPHRRERIWIMAYAMSAGEWGKQRKSQTKSHALSNPDCQRLETERSQQQAAEFGIHGPHVSNAVRNRWNEVEQQDGRGKEVNGVIRAPLQRDAIWWQSESGLGGNAHGLAKGMDCNLRDCLSPLAVLEFSSWLMGSTNEDERVHREVLRMLRSGIISQAIWEKTGRFFSVYEAALLLAEVCEHQDRPNQARVFMACAKAFEKEMRVLRSSKETSGTSYRPGHNQQSAREYSDLVQVLLRLLAQYGKKAWVDHSWENGVPRTSQKINHRVDRLKAIGNGQVPAVVRLAWETLTERISSHA